MILSQADLRRAVEEGQIEFDPPLEEGQWGEASVDLRLGYQFTTLKQQKGVTISVATALSRWHCQTFGILTTSKSQTSLADPDLMK